MSPKRVHPRVRGPLDTVPPADADGGSRTARRQWNRRNGGCCPSRKEWRRWESNPRPQPLHVGVYVCSSQKSTTARAVSIPLTFVDGEFGLYIFHPPTRRHVTLRDYPGQDTPRPEPLATSGPDGSQLSSESEVLVVVGTCRVFRRYLRGHRTPRHAASICTTPSKPFRPHDGARG